MSLERRAGAPRLIEWTGERCVPWTADVQVVYEHLHRYMWAAQLVAGKRVLDLGSGEGFGASLLSDTAAAVVGVDIDQSAVNHAQLNWSTDTLSFQLGSALDLSIFDEGSFDVVVAFEIIEHVADQQRVLAEVERVLSPDGVFVVSTPDRRLYSEATGQENPFHERELTAEEFLELLQGTFANVALWGQRTISGSHLGLLVGSPPTERSPSPDYFIERSGEEWRIAGEPAGLYLVAIASNALLPGVDAQSTLADCGLELMRAKEQEGVRLAEAVMVERDQSMGRERAAQEQITRAEQESAKAIAHREAEVERWKAQVAQRDVEVRGRDVELQERDEFAALRQQEIESLRQRQAEYAAHVEHIERQLVVAHSALRRVESSVTWQLFQRVRGRVFSAVGGERSIPVRVLQLAIRSGGRLFKHPRPPASSAQAAAPTAAVGPPIVLPTFENPTASLVIPLYSGAQLTRRCLETIRDTTDQVSYEVILVDDAADAETKQLLDCVKGAQVVRNERNQGYLRSVNEGASGALGKWLVLCNNDIEVTAGWLGALIGRAKSAENVGVVAPKYISPDGSLSEAGAILWRDGSGANYGRGDDPGRPQYDFTRDIDYGSAAALLVSRELWSEIGGYDELYMPMYYEDADLCMRARQLGWRVLYEPTAIVVHVEGGTAGTDLQSGHKRHQEVNRVKFVSKWRDTLDRDHLPPGSPRSREAANRGRGPRVLVVDFRTPMWDRDAGSLRMYQIMRSLLRHGFDVTFAPDNHAPLEPYAAHLRGLGIEVVGGETHMTQLLAEIGPQLTAAILSRPHIASRWLDSVREYAPSALAIYDTVDLHWVRETRRFMLGSNGASREAAKIAPEGSKAQALLELELAMIRASDATIAVTEDERAQILHWVPDAQVAIIPTVHAVAEHVPSASGRAGLLFVGGFEHPPNADAVTYLVREVMPRVWLTRPDVKVTIVGGSAPPEVQHLASTRVDVKGWVEDLQPLLESSRAMVVPVRFGAGVKGKITQGLSSGLPVVTTSVGAEGLDGRDGETMLVGDTVEALADRILQVVEDDALWQKLSSRGLELVAASCSLEVLDERLLEVLAIPGRLVAGRV